MRVFVTNHALSGVLIGRLLKDRPGTALLAGVASHLALDMVPHWGCSVAKLGKKRSYQQKRPSTSFLTAAKRDGVLGLMTMAAATIAVERPARVSTVAAMTAAILLDLDKPLFYFFGITPFPSVVQRLHGWVQNESPDGLSNELRVGFAFASADLFTIVRGRHRG
jgi:hypothetical protein